MAEIETFQGFFSYARHDAETDPKLIEALTARLEKRVSGKLTNARFTIWRDVNAIRTGQRWDERIAEAVRASHVFIVLMTPKWFESAYCRKEYLAFEEVEPEVGEYVVPLLARPIDRQIENFDQAQKEIQDSLDRRQYRKVIASDFLLQTDDQRDHFIDNIADDIEGMIQRRRGKPATGASPGAVMPTRRAKRTYEFSANAHNLEDVDFVSAAEILVEPRDGDARRSVFAHLAFVERLYVKTSTARVEFSIRRAFLSIDDGGAGKLEPNPDWVGFATSGSIYYLGYKHAPPKAITVCINPQPGKTGIADLPLPPAKDENYLSVPAKAAADLDIGSLRAELTVSLCAEGLFVSGEDPVKPSAASGKKIATIAAVLVAKNQVAGNSGRVSRRIPVRERTP